MFRSQFYDHHQGLITVLVQLLLISVHTSSYFGLWLYVVCAYDVSFRVVSGYVHKVHTLCIFPCGVWLCTVVSIQRRMHCQGELQQTALLHLWMCCKIKTTILTLHVVCCALIRLLSNNGFTDNSKEEVFVAFKIVKNHRIYLCEDRGYHKWLISIFRSIRDDIV
jgi:hypothetical protein